MIKEQLTIWKNVKKNLEYAIIRGEFRTGEKMPSIAQVSDIYKCGKSTAKKVLEIMCNEEILYKRKGVGYFVDASIVDKLVKRNNESLEERLNECIQDAHNMGIAETVFNEWIKRKIQNTYKDWM